MALTARSKVLVAFLSLYIIWGSTYLAIAFAIETIPPFLMAGTRFLLAGAVLYAFSRRRDRERPVRVQWRTAVIVGCLLMTGNVCIALAEQRIPSGVASLLVATVPLWMVLMDWWRPHGRQPKIGVAIGLLVGLAGVAVLVGPGELAGGDRIDIVGAGIVVFGSVAWAAGSIYSRHAPRTDSAFLMTAMQMLCGGAFLTIIGIGIGEVGRFELAAVSMRSLSGYIYLVIFGSLVGFTSYIYLLRESSPARVATYAYVNPVVAVILGWAIGGEAISSRMLLASLVIIAGVALITTFGKAPPPRLERVEEPGEARHALRRVTDEYPVAESA